MIAKDQILQTYRQLRLMAGGTLIALPLAIVLVGLFEYPEILPTLSHYYFFEEHPGKIRTMFTGFLILVGGVMIAYRGFDEKDNQIHNYAGLAALCVAAFPKLHDKADRFYSEGFFSYLHGPAAVALFLLAAYAVWYGGGEKLRTALNESERVTVGRWKWFSLITMAAGIGIYVSFLVFDKIFAVPSFGILIVELFGFFGFAAHWLVMTYVISKANNRTKSDRATRSRSEPTKPESALQVNANAEGTFIP